LNGEDRLHLNQLNAVTAGLLSMTSGFFRNTQNQRVRWSCGWRWHWLDLSLVDIHRALVEGCMLADQSFEE
jgi:hypothetical protein